MKPQQQGPIDPPSYNSKASPLSPSLRGSLASGCIHSLFFFFPFLSHTFIV